MQIPIIVTSAAATDIPALCGLLNELFTQESEFKPDYKAQSRGLAAIIDHPELGGILLARRQDQVLGMVNMLFTVSTALGERVALLEDMVVAPSTRNAGIGSMLIERAIAFAKQNGCKRITLLTDLSNEAAQRFYARHGFEASRMIPLRLNLEEE